MGSSPTGSDAAHVSAVHSSDGTTSLSKTAPTGSQSSEDHGRPITRGRGDGGRSASHPRRVQEKTSRQTPHQEGDLPSGATPNVPPPMAPESTPPQWGGQTRQSG